jgi:hypothetical protein
MDWVTISGPNEPVYRIWNSLDAFVDYYELNGHKIQNVRFRDYSGIKIGNLALFEGATYSFIQGQGSDSELLAEAQIGYDTTCTRVDLQVTLTNEGSEGRGWGDRVHSTALESGSNIAVSRLQSRGGGDTIYIGSRASSRMGRVYRKDIESPDEDWEPNTWRWEVELKKPVSHVVFKQLMSMSREERGVSLADYVVGWFEKRGVYCPIKTGDSLAINDSVPKVVSPLDKKLKWLGVSVGPTVRQLLDAGKANELLRELGIAASPILAQHILRALKAAGHALADID